MNKFSRYRFTFLALAIAFFSTHSQAAYEQKIYYVGMSCASIQRDSAITPANEIFIHTHVRQLRNGKVRAQSHPRGKPGYYKKVTKGFFKHEDTLIWQGRQQPVELRVTMWEHDNGGTAVHVFSNYLTIFLTGKVANMPEGGSVGGPSKDPVTMAFKNAGDQLFGTGNDFVGYQRVPLGKGDWAGEPRKRRGPITYNFVTHHRKGGANCKAYFLFERGDSYKELKPIKKPTPYRPPNTNETIYQPAPGQNLEQARYQCKQTYDACRHRAVNCQSQFDRQYNSCTKNLRDKLNDCVEWHRKKHGRAEPKCNQFKDIRKYCGYSKSKCPTTSECQGAHNRCQSAAYLNDQDQQHSSGYKPQQAPQVEPRPPAQPMKEDRGYIIWLKNECKQEVFVAYRYKSFVHNKWVTAGWTPLKPGEKKRAPINTEHSAAYFHSDLGKIQDGAHRKPAEYQVVDDSFEHIQDTKLNGKNLRKMPFRFYNWKASQIKSTVKIAECASHQDKRAIEERGKEAMLEALFDIAHQPHYKINSVKKLVENGAPIDSRNLRGETPLLVAARLDHAGAVGGFIRTGADVNAKNIVGNSSLHHAVYKDNYNLVNMLIKNGADVNAKTKGGRSVLDAALTKNNAKIIALLVSADAKGKSNVSTDHQFKNSNTLLHQAVSLNDLALATKLIKDGANVNAENKKGAVPLSRIGDWSSKKKNMIELLLKSGADPKKVKGLLHRIIKQQENKHARTDAYDITQKMEMIQLILDHGVDINAQDYYENNALHSIVWLGSGAPKLMQFVAKNGISVNHQNKKQKDTALHLAASRFFPSESNGTGPDIDNRINTLLAIGVDPNIQNKRGETALHVLLHRVIDDCLLRNNVGCRTEKELNALYEKVKLLVDKGTDTNLADKKGSTPKKLADQIKNKGLSKKISALMNQ